MHPQPRVAQLRLQFAARGEHIIGALLHEHRHDDRLVRRNRGRQDESAVVAVDADDRAEQPLRHAIGGLVAVLLLALRVLVAHVERARPLVAVVVDRRHL